jgi:hypothetical protein
LSKTSYEILLDFYPEFPFAKAGVDICTVPAAYLTPQSPTAPQERNFSLFPESGEKLEPLSEW